MSEPIGRDPNFRSQYESGVEPDAQFEAALSGSPQPRITLLAVSRPIGESQQWASQTGPVRLR